MATHEHIFTPDGEPMEVLSHLVGDLLLNKGWSRTLPVADPDVALSDNHKVFEEEGFDEDDLVDDVEQDEEDELHENEADDHEAEDEHEA